MRKIIALLVLPLFTSCQSAQNKDRADTPKVNSAKIKLNSPPPTVFDVPKELFGVWKSVSAGNDENANFAIRDDKFYYVDFKDGCPFKVLKDSIFVTYEEGDIQRMAYRFKGKDTLMLITADESSTFSRVKN